MTRCGIFTFGIFGFLHLALLDRFGFTMCNFHNAELLDFTRYTCECTTFGMHDVHKVDFPRCVLSGRTMCTSGTVCTF